MIIVHQKILMFGIVKINVRHAGAQLACRVKRAVRVQCKCHVHRPSSERRTANSGPAPEGYRLTSSHYDRAAERADGGEAVISCFPPLQLSSLAFFPLWARELVQVSRFSGRRAPLRARRSPYSQVTRLLAGLSCDQ